MFFWIESVGNPGLSLDEEKTHFSLWAMWSAPLIAGNDPRSMNGTDDASKILLNTEVIAIDQDPAVNMATKVMDHAGLQVWDKQLQATGSHAVGLVNITNTPTAMSVNANTIGLTTITSIHDLWLHQDITSVSNTYSAIVPAHGIVLLKISGN